ncbi:hypothetical protein [Brucella intermedia]|uniref:hypothetical protein n=1 Tax=Brucella intermedia TaxID=94625 RepID=UPI00244AE90D|nr:hypothetical protein [Brucella intermedia]WGG61962.1 hypothetical protein QA414_15715 [Brucella intermedia]
MLPQRKIPLSLPSRLKRRNDPDVTGSILNLGTAVDIATLISLLFAIRQLAAANATSAANLSLKLDETLKSTSKGIEEADTFEEYQLLTGDLLNTCEVACGMILDKAVHGFSKGILIGTINSSLGSLDESPYFIDIVKELKRSDAIFINIYNYLLDRRIHPELRAALMPTNPVRKSKRILPWSLSQHDD